MCVTTTPKNFHTIDLKDKDTEFQIPTSVTSPGSDEIDPFSGLCESDYNPPVEIPPDLPSAWMENDGFHQV